jgi:GDPmannose 4,6-dehydratase
LFNHESPIRGETFVTRKIVRALVKIKKGLQSKLSLGNLNAKRDWGHAKDFVEAMWLMLQQEKPEDFVIATGKQHSVRQFIEEVAKNLQMEIVWQGAKEDEVGLWNGAPIIKVDPKYYRPAEVETLLGDPTKAKQKLNWQPKITFNQLIEDMVSQEMQLNKIFK